MQVNVAKTQTPAGRVHTDTLCSMSPRPAGVTALLEDPTKTHSFQIKPIQIQLNPIHY